jgi:CRP/FNR family transcriptional regulator, cyclic AMP receptor protein
LPVQYVRGDQEETMAKRSDQIDLLSGVDLFSGLSRKEVGLVLQYMRDHEFPAGRVVVSEGEEGGRFFLIVSGNAVVRRGGRRIRKLGPGDSFGDIALIDGGPRSATVEAETPLSTLSLATWNFKGALRENPSMGFKLLLVLCKRLREAESRAPI